VEIKKKFGSGRICLRLCENTSTIMQKLMWLRCRLNGLLDSIRRMGWGVLRNLAKL
jgi:hypothetical protein